MMSLEVKKMMALQNLSWEAQATPVDAGFENCGHHFVASSRSGLAFDHCYWRGDLPEHHTMTLNRAGQEYHVVSEILVGAYWIA